MAYTIQVNGVKRTVDVDGDMPLLWVLRDELDLKGSKFGCGVGLCGTCTVHVDGTAVRSCSTPISSVGQRGRRHHRRDGGQSRGEDAAGSLDGPGCAAMRARQIRFQDRRGLKHRHSPDTA